MVEFRIPLSLVYWLFITDIITKKKANIVKQGIYRQETEKFCIN